MNAYDYYSEAKRLAEALENSGFSDYGAEIVGAMEEGGTGTEILMIMRMRLTGLLAVERLPLNLRESIQVLHDRLDNALM
ncbi:hypothetical protein [Azonexus hydrophilus]|uniref:hypothetical protein n=1 Tax=Azonexus hydrophilus TaxID=418702 RepID=UPI0019668802|nr:hypothetical protein [Azonexus hydrophilus]